MDATENVFFECCKKQYKEYICKNLKNCKPQSFSWCFKKSRAPESSRNSSKAQQVRKSTSIKHHHAK